VILLDRVILHSDLNNFYASVECLHNPSIRNKPVAVCGSQEERHGIVLAKNYIAKKYGIKTGEASWEASKKCPDLVIVPPNFHLYLETARNVREIYSYYTNEIEPFGLDENWLNLTNYTDLFGDGEKVADEIRAKIRKELGLTVSVGVSYNKIFAKLGSDIKKPDATTCITKENFKDVVWRLPVSDLLYVGHQTKKKLYNIGIYTIGSLANAPIEFLISTFGKWGQTLWSFANGYDSSIVTSKDFEYPIKSVGNSLTSPIDLKNDEEVKVLIYMLSESVSARLRKHKLKGKTIKIWIKDTELQGIERQGQLFKPTYITYSIATKAFELFQSNWNWSKNVRALGVRVANLEMANRYTQLTFLPDIEQKHEPIEFCIDLINDRYGRHSLHRAILLSEKRLFHSPFEANQIHPLSYFR
jgi:DNA polymerase-4